MDNNNFNIGDMVRDKRFNMPIYGEVLYIIDTKAEKNLVIKTNKGNFSVPTYMVEHI